MARPKRPQMSGSLAVLLGETTAMSQARSDATTTLPVSALKPGAAQPRRSFSEASLESLAASIRSEGVLQPLLVRPVAGGHEIVAGERRWRAAQLAGLTEVPVLVRELDDRQATLAALLENLQREDLNPIDEVDGKLGLIAVTLGVEQEEARARLMQLLKEAPGPEHDQLTELFGSLGETWMSFAKNKVRILNWPSDVLDAMRSGLPLSVAGVIAAAPKDLRAELLARAEEGASRAELQEHVRRHTAVRMGEKSSGSDASAVAQRLSSRRFMGGLTDVQKRALDQWLAKRPAFLREPEAKD